jgi:hypothetical protein
VPRLRPLLGLAAALAAALGAWALVWTPSLAAPEAAGFALTSPGAVAAGAARQDSPDPSITTTIVQGNVFSPTRSAPRTRYVPGESFVESGASTDAPIAASDTAAQPGASGDAVPKLYGTILRADGPQALLRLDARVSSPALYRVGDRAGGYRVAEIGERSVTLEGPSGRVVLRIKTPETR